MEKKFIFDRAILIDDNKIDNILNKKIVEKENISKEVETFNDPLKALAYINEAMLSEKMFKKGSSNAIFIDLIMPEMNGVSFVSELNKLFGEFTKSLTVVFISSSLSCKSELNSLNNLNFKVSFITKPISKNKLLANLEKVM